MAKASVKPPQTAETASIPATAKVLGYQIAPYSGSNLTKEVKLKDNIGKESPHRQSAKKEASGDAPDILPKPDRLKDDPEFIQYVKDNLWDNRRDRGIPWRKDVFEFITETYFDPWIKDRGMVQADLISLDDPLCNRLRVMTSRKGAPEGFVFPTQAEASLNAISDPEERRIREIVRESERKRIASYRASLRNEL